MRGTPVNPEPETTGGRADAGGVSAGGASGRPRHPRGPRTLFEPSPFLKCCFTLASRFVLFGHAACGISYAEVEAAETKAHLGSVAWIRFKLIGRCVHWICRCGPIPRGSHAGSPRGARNSLPPVPGKIRLSPSAFLRGLRTAPESVPCPWLSLAVGCARCGMARNEGLVNTDVHMARVLYMATSLTSRRPPLGPYNRPIYALRRPEGGARLLMREVTL